MGSANRNESIPVTRSMVRSQVARLQEVVRPQEVAQPQEVVRSQEVVRYIWAVVRPQVVRRHVFLFHVDYLKIVSKNEKEECIEYAKEN